MRIDLTPLARGYFRNSARRCQSWRGETEAIQRKVLKNLIAKAGNTEFGIKHGFRDILHGNEADIYERYREAVAPAAYETFRESVMRMIKGGKDILWPGVCRDFAQSSGTSGGKSKFVPVTRDSLYGNHFKGAQDAMGHYLLHNPRSKIFSGKGLILGGSFSNTLGIENSRVKVGDLSATLINRILPFAEMFRVPDKKTALLPDWEQKLPAIAAKASKEYVTNISGVPSWFLTVLRRVMEYKKVSSLAEVWPGLEVFFHGGISFEPYREQYLEITRGLDMHFLETYNASEGFFAVQDDPDDKGMLLLIDRNVFYEFIPIDAPNADPIPAWELRPDSNYELLVTATNGLWRYRIGDTVRVTQTDPVKLIISGRTGAFINAFGEELMQDNAEKAMAEACTATGAGILNYTAAPLYATEKRRGRHQWLIEWQKEPADIEEFSRILDRELRSLNSDYDAKRSGNIFLDGPEIISAQEGLFDEWLHTTGSHKLGGQRKVPRLSNNREILESLLKISKKQS